MSPITNLFSGPKKADPVKASTPSVNTEPAGSDPEKMRQIGRASLIATTPQGVLGNAQTGRKKLLS